jgi:hypothetical protein
MSDLATRLNGMRSCAPLLGEPADALVKLLIDALMKAIEQRDYWLASDEWEWQEAKETDDAELLAILEGK